MSPHLPLDTLARLQRPVLVVCGEKDDTAGAPEPLAAAFRAWPGRDVAGRDHMSAVGDRNTRQAVIDFFRA